MGDRRDAVMHVTILGAGKVGRALAAALRARGARVVLRAARAGLPRTRVDADVVLLAVRDKDLAPLAERLAASGKLAPRCVCVHAAGARDAETIAALRPACAGVAQMHPMISFASLRFYPSLERGNVHVSGDRTAVRRACALAKLLGMAPRTFRGLDTVAYHAAAGLVANGAAALAALGARILEDAGVPRRDAPKLLGPLLRSVAENVEALGFPHALTGPVRRGDADAVARHGALLAARVPEAVAFYRASVAAQLPLAKALAEAPPEGLRAIARWLEEGSRPPARTRSSARAVHRKG